MIGSGWGEPGRLARMVLTALACVAAPGGLRELGAQDVDSVTTSRRLPERVPMWIGRQTAEAEMTRNGTAQSSGTSLQRIAPSGAPGSGTLTLRSEPQGPGLGTWYALEVRSSDLAPLRFTMRTARDSADVTIAGNAVRGWRDGPQHGRQAIDERLPAAPFHEMLVEHVLARLPLREGYAAAIYTYHPFVGAGWKGFRVAGTDTVDTGAGSEPAWRIVQAAEGPYGGEVTLWIATASRRLVRQRVSLANGVVITTRFVPAS